MANVKGSDSGTGNPGDRNEFVEVYNQSSDTIDLSTYSLSDFDAVDIIKVWTDTSILNKCPDLRINSTLIFPNSYAVILDPEYTSTDTLGGYSQPYELPESTLILTVGNTTIGDGLSTKDPLILFSVADSCTTSFGTPFVEDDFPFDPGDGISLERIELNAPDSIWNWYPAIDPQGCTPGRENSVTNAFDLALNENLISFTPAVLKIGEDASIKIGVVNKGLRPVVYYQLKIFEDLNQDSSLNNGELIAEIPGENVGAFDTIYLYHTLKRPKQGEHTIGFLIEFEDDRDLTNNICFKTLRVLGTIGELSLSPQVFTPNGDGIDDCLQIDYRLPQSGGELTISIFDTRGKRVCDILKNKLMEKDKGTCYWDGELNNEQAQTGMYIVYLEYRYQNKITKAKKTTVLARK